LFFQRLEKIPPEPSRNFSFVVNSLLDLIRRTLIKKIDDGGRQGARSYLAHMLQLDDDGAICRERKKQSRIREK
jgi:hypothetical protein